MRRFIIKLTQSAGKILLQYFGKDEDLVKLRRSVKDITTKYDVMVDRFIIREITKKYPTHNLLTEESGFIDSNSEYTWIVDSLDGTANYAYGNPLFCVCIALLQNNEVILGTIYVPAINEFYLAEKGKGAFFNGKRIHVSLTDILSGSYVFICEGGEKNRARNARIMSRIYPKVVDVRKLGSAGLEAAWIACGRGDAYLTTKIRPWDIAPGVLLVKEAGGLVSDFKNNPWAWEVEQSDLIFSNKKMHPIIQELVKTL